MLFGYAVNYILFFVNVADIELQLHMEVNTHFNLSLFCVFVISYDHLIIRNW